MRSSRFEACSNSQNVANDIWTSNGILRTPTPSANVSPSPSATVSPTLDATARASDTPEASATPEPTEVSITSAAYLPVSLLERCSPQELAADVVLALDASTSMTEEVRPQVTKKEAAVEAASRFVRVMSSSDQGAVLWFNSEARVEQTLTSNVAALEVALGRIPTGQFTRIDLGIKVAREELASPRRLGGNRSVIILLTDGKANPEPIETAVGESRVAKAAGVTIFTIGLGPQEELDDDSLRMIASRPEYYHQTPNAEDLSRIYEEIAGVIPCPVSQYWGRR
jgi:Mg-chelatase subunit ChlD